jgi:UDP-N-acetylglucosamine 2-epimerase (non-hydrolysing)
MHLLIVFGTRPEAIKMAPLVKAAKKDPAFETTVCVTAQHRQMLDQVLELFEIQPDIDLDLMRVDQDLYELTSRILCAVRDVLKRVKPDLVMVQGDTTTTMATGLASFYAGVPVGHVEAGLRTWNLKAPFPEEANRSLTSRITDFHFCPTEKNAYNLKSEGIDQSKIFITGNTVIDALMWVRHKVAGKPPETWDGCWGSAADAVRENSPILLVTGHRRESFGQGVRDFCSALMELAFSHPDWQVIYPVHLNPNICDPVREMLGGEKNIHLIEPLDYAPFVYLMDRSRIILTDSGGVQEEAPSLGKPVLVMRETTERPEALEAGTVKLVGTDREKIVGYVEELMQGGKLYQEMSRTLNPYGDGRAVERILKIMRNEK